MRVLIDDPRQDQHAGRVDDVLAASDAVADFGDLPFADENVGFALRVGGHNRSPTDQHGVTSANAGSSADLVQVARVEVEAVDDLPECGDRLHRVAAFERCQVFAVPEQPDEALIALNQRPLVLAELNAHGVLHARILSSPAVPMTVRSSCNRFAFSSNRGTLPFAALLAAMRRPSCACDSDFASAVRIRPGSMPSRGGISTSTSISSCRPSAV